MKFKLIMLFTFFFLCTSCSMQLTDVTDKNVSAEVVTVMAPNSPVLVVQEGGVSKGEAEIELNEMAKNATSANMGELIVTKTTSPNILVDKSGRESRDDFMSMVRQEPYLLEVVLNNQPQNILALFDISQQDVIYLISVLQGELPFELQSQLTTGLAFDNCINNECGKIDGARLSLEKSVLDLSIKTAGLASQDFNQDLISSSLANRLSFNDTNFSLNSDGYVNVKGNRFFMKAILTVTTRLLM